MLLQYSRICLLSRLRLLLLLLLCSRVNSMQMQ
jgi:hypothetical protein